MTKEEFITRVEEVTARLNAINEESKKVYDDCLRERRERKETRSGIT